MSKPRQALNSTWSKYPGLLGRIGQALGTHTTTGIARELSVSPSLISDWKSQRAFPTLFHLTEIAEKGGTTVDWLLSNKGVPAVGISVAGEERAVLSLVERSVISDIAKATGARQEEVAAIFMRAGMAAWGHEAGCGKTTLEIAIPLISQLSQLDFEMRRIVGTEIISLISARLDGRRRDWHEVSESTLERGEITAYEKRHFMKQYKEWKSSKNVSIQETAAELHAAANELPPEWKARLDLDYPDDRKGKREDLETLLALEEEESPDSEAGEKLRKVITHELRTMLAPKTGNSKTKRRSNRK